MKIIRVVNFDIIFSALASVAVISAVVGFVGGYGVGRAEEKIISAKTKTVVNETSKENNDE